MQEFQTTMAKMTSSLVMMAVLIGYTAALSNNTFPAHFSFGVGTSAYQVEGDGMENRGENIWDHAIKANPKIIEDGSNASSADESYTHYEDDFKALAQMGITHYKLSISWSRMIPTGYTDNIDDMSNGTTHYQALISELVKQKITPVVVLYNWDLPQPIQDYGGWTNESNIDAFVMYARKVFKYCSEAKYFITFDNPRAICKNGYGDGSLAPFSSNSGLDDYECARVLLKAHAAVYKVFKEEFASKNGAKISIALDASWSIPASNNEADKEAAERRNLFEFGLYADPIFKTGNWPQVVIDRTDLRSKGEGAQKSRLPIFNQTEKDAIKGTFDFMAIEFFDTKLVADDTEAKFETSSYDNDLRVKTSNDPNWTVDADEHAIAPGSLRNLLKYIRDNYNNPEILITASGISDDNGTYNDDHRVAFLADQLSDVADAINEDKVNVFGYTYWSLLDSFEWTKGMKPHFGLYAVNLELETSRVEKKSAQYYALAIKERKPVDPADVETTTTSTTTEGHQGGAGNRYQPVVPVIFIISLISYVLQ
ncbi:myrosinase 1 [Diabrotica virgifera virgifera]|uniref:Myrosinase 1-like n=1 Tax=Diabrotica virgifera virgifera TaxID=50390 RepID=A0A6P7F1W5_DIAVI|nr:myrosinase 1 [Diabrotica virgifera virgifera]